MPEKPSNTPFPGYVPSTISHAQREKWQKESAEGTLPFLNLPAPEMELFDPDRHLANTTYRSDAHSGPSSTPPPLPLYVAARTHSQTALIPREEDCLALWDKYGMLDNIRSHSRQVANMALGISRLGREKGLRTHPEAIYAAGLLHDLGKTYTILHGGNHAQLGAAWVMHETRNPEIARCVSYHVYWPWEEHLYQEAFFSVLAIAYADKRVQHDKYVSLDERFSDLMERYGKSEYTRYRIGMTWDQGKRIEDALSRQLGVNLHEYTADSRRLVKRA